MKKVMSLQVGTKLLVGVLCAALSVPHAAAFASTGARPVEQVENDVVRSCGYFKYCVEQDGTATIVGYDSAAMQRDYPLDSPNAKKWIPIPAQVDEVPVKAIGDGALDLTYDLEVLGRFVLPEGIERVGKRAMCNASVRGLPSTLVEIGAEAFAYDDSGCADKENATPKTYVGLRGKLPANLEKVGARCFFRARVGSTLKIPASLKHVGEAAFCCTGLKKISVAQGNHKFASSRGMLLTKSGRRLLTCPAGKAGDVKVPAGVKTVAERAFYGSSAKTVTVPPSVKRIGSHAFEKSRQLTKVSLPNGVREIGAYAFLGCGRLKQVRIPESLKAVREGVFESCGSLSGVVEVPQSVTSIGAEAFSGCELAEFKLPKSVRIVGSSAFANCANMRVVNLGGANAIGFNAFEGCSALRSVTFGKRLKQISAGAFGGVSLSCSFKVPVGKAKKYTKLLRKSGVKAPKVKAVRT